MSLTVEDMRPRLESFDGMAGMRNALRQLARERDHWAGIPLPLEGERLVIEPSYPYADLAKIGPPEATPAADRAGWTIRSHFWSTLRSSEVYILTKPDGTLTWGLVPGVHHLDHDLHTLGCADAWGIEQEQKALMLLGTLIRHRQFKQYLLTGMFMESSTRSGVHYLFRRLKPTVAITGRDPIRIGPRSHREPGLRILASLCLHPIGFYEGSWAGSLCPTDDVIAHLMLMRGDEAMFWRRANQHAPFTPAAGL